MGTTTPCLVKPWPTELVNDTYNSHGLTLDKQRVCVNLCLLPSTRYQNFQVYKLAKQLKTELNLGCKITWPAAAWFGLDPRYPERHVSPDEIYRINPTAVIPSTGEKAFVRPLITARRNEKGGKKQGFCGLCCLTWLDKNSGFDNSVSFSCHRLWPVK